MSNEFEKMQLESLSRLEKTVGEIQSCLENVQCRVKNIEKIVLFLSEVDGTVESEVEEFPFKEFKG